jgi:phosphoenolpyruvate carboxykinase (ATP)
MTPEVTFAAIRGALTENIKWKYDDILGCEIPETLEIENPEQYHPYTHYTRSEYAQMIGALRKERREYLAGFSGLAAEIVDAV